jgi:hypothetical protein
MFPSQQQGGSARNGPTDGAPRPSPRPKWTRASRRHRSSHPRPPRQMSKAEMDRGIVLAAGHCPSDRRSEPAILI